MTETVETVETAEVSKTSIRPDISKMVKTDKGSYHKDDFLGHALSGLTVDQVKTVGVELGVDVQKYAHLNPGQQRMNVGNALRRISVNLEAADKITTLSAPMQEANASAKAAEIAEKAAAKEAKAAEKTAADAAKAAKKAKVADSAEGEGSVE